MRAVRVHKSFGIWGSPQTGRLVPGRGACPQLSGEAHRWQHLFNAFRFALFREPERRLLIGERVGSANEYTDLRYKYRRGRRCLPALRKSQVVLHELHRQTFLHLKFRVVECPPCI